MDIKPKDILTIVMLGLGGLVLYKVYRKFFPSKESNYDKMSQAEIQQLQARNKSGLTTQYVVERIEYWLFISINYHLFHKGKNSDNIIKGEWNAMTEAERNFFRLVSPHAFERDLGILMSETGFRPVTFFD